jgi:hypothetical protein
MDKYTQLQLEAITDELTNIRDRLEAIRRSAESPASIESIQGNLDMAIHDLNNIND